jgi:hypothetical protein
MNGYCIAGIDIDSGKWVRPVGSDSYGELVSREITVQDQGTHRPRLMKPLDIVHLRLGRHVDNIGQPENWMLEINSKMLPHSILGQGVDDKSILAQIRDVVEQSSSSSLILGTQGKEVSHREIQKEPLSQSLCVIGPNNLTWVRTTSFKNKPRIEGWFDFGKRNIRYCLPLTDIVWEAKLLDLITVDGQTLDASETPGVNIHTEILLTISLGDLFEKTQSHYKLIAGVLLLPKI